MVTNGNGKKNGNGNNHAGRPSKINPEIIAKILSWISEDSYFEVACRACGISRQTGYNWLERGKKEAERIDAGEPPYEADALYLYFYYRVDQAEAQCEVEDVRYIRGGFADWQSKAWIRERKNFDRWGRKETREVTGKDGKPLFVELLEKLRGLDDDGDKKS